ncbi:MAG: hypothetical protein DCF30_18880 [Hyphomicrobiales bacterium]|nr:MAG: hypothetical protein DCF30_18880 [Hyphomicrobiales bacterium]
MPASDSTASVVSAPPAVPGWAVPRGLVTSDVEAAFLAGSALNSLDNLVRMAPTWAGSWRQRLALKCATTAAALNGRTESEAQLRDAWHLRAPGADPGPAGNLLAAWKGLAERSPIISPDRLRRAANLLGLRWSDSLLSLGEQFEVLARSGQPAPLVAAAIATEAYRLRPDAGLLGWWSADLAIAARMRWPVAVPLLVTQAPGPAFRSLSDRGRVRPGGEGFERAICVALALAATEACRSAGEIALRAARLNAATRKLRAKGAGEVIQLLLDEDCVSGTLQTKNLTRWGSRRLFERLTALEAVRELSGRASFRLYGL